MPKGKPEAGQRAPKVRRTPEQQRAYERDEAERARARERERWAIYQQPTRREREQKQHEGRQP